MTGRDKDAKPPSYTGNVVNLRDHIPERLLQAGRLRTHFDPARDPLFARQLEDLHRTESERRADSQSGSSMVRRDRPRPELRPKHELGPIRETFNQNWLAEQRRARLAQFEAERAARGQSQAREAGRSFQPEPER